jgi:hypothetical protein
MAAAPIKHRAEKSKAELFSLTHGLRLRHDHGDGRGTHMGAMAAEDRREWLREQESDDSAGRGARSIEK